MGKLIFQIAAMRKEAGAKQVELEITKRQEASASRDREVQRKQRLAAILGAQAASAAAKGIALSGSVANISLEDARRASRESLIDDVNTSARISALSRRSRSISRLLKFRTVITIFKAAEDAALRGASAGAGGGGGGGAGSATTTGAPI